MSLTRSTPYTIPEKRLEARFDRLRARERQTVRELGIATARGLSGEDALAELRQLRDEMESVAAALRFLESLAERAPHDRL